MSVYETSVINRLLAMNYIDEGNDDKLFEAHRERLDFVTWVCVVMAELATVGAVEATKVLLKWGNATIDRGMQYEGTLENSRQMLESLDPVVGRIKELYMTLDRPPEETQTLDDAWKKYRELVDKYSSSSRSKWGPLRFLSYPCKQTKLEKTDADLRRHSFDLAVLNRRDLLDIFATVKQFFEVLNRTEFFGQHQFRGLRGAPPEPDQCIGMDEPLHWLRINLLNGEDSVLVLTGLGGSGKSTLAKKICWDPQIKDKFGGNIFFFTVSKTPNFKNIVKSLFEHCGCPVPEFQSDGDEDAANQLGVLLSLVGENENPILLVLDDVWSVSLVRKFSIKIPNYKILVTSRCALTIGSSCPLAKLRHDNAVALFRHFAQLNEQSSYMPDEKRVNEIVSCCKGSPLALKVIGGSLCRKPFEVWQNMEKRLNRESILELDDAVDLLYCLQQSVDMCSMNEKLCFMDLGLFPKDQRIPATALTDMWSELYKLDENFINVMAIVHDLTTRNLINVIVTRKVGKDEDMYYNNHFIMLHDVLRDLAIRQSKDEPIEKKERLSIDLNGDSRPKWWVGRNQQGIIGRVISFILGQKLRVAARILSIYTDETFTSDWCDMLPDKAEVLILNHHSSQYSLPKFTKKMRKLKVLIVINYGFHRSELNKFELLRSLSNLKRIRLEKVSVPSLCILKNLQKLSLHMCNTNQAFKSGSIKISDAMPNLVEMNIDYCKDLDKLPDELCNITTLEKLSITNCHGLSSLPKDIAKLENLEVLRLCSCTSLVEMPNSVTGLDKVNCIDISDCISLEKLPDDIGKMKKLEKLYLKGCSELRVLPDSVVDDFGNLNHTIYVICACDEERAALWKQFPTIPKNLIIDETPIEEANLNWLRSSSF